MRAILLAIATRYRSAGRSIQSTRTWEPMGLAVTALNLAPRAMRSRCGRRAELARTVRSARRPCGEEGGLPLNGATRRRLRRGVLDRLSNCKPSLTARDVSVSHLRFYSGR